MKNKSCADRNAFHAAAVVLLFSWLQPAAAAQLTVTVRDVEGQPVNNAAVSLHRADEGSEPKASPLVVDQQGKQFSPWVSAAPRGTDLVFTNHDDITHHVYSFSPVRRFSFRLRPGEEHMPLDLPDEGVIVLGCNIHDWMVGYVLVTDARHVGTTDAEGQIVFTDLAEGDWEARLWHPGMPGDDAPLPLSLRLGDTPAELAFRLAAPLRETGPREPLDDSGYASP